MFVDYDVNLLYPSRFMSLETERMELGQLFVNEASSYATDLDEVEYYWVKPKYTSDILYNISIYDWCKEKFGPSGWGSETGTRWTASDRKFFFRDEKDRTMFILKWSI